MYLTVEIGHRPSCPATEMRSPCSSSRKTPLIVPALPSVKTKALPANSFSASCSSRKLFIARASPVLEAFTMHLFGANSSGAFYHSGKLTRACNRRALASALSSKATVARSPSRSLDFTFYVAFGFKQPRQCGDVTGARPRAAAVACPSASASLIFGRHVADYGRRILREDAGRWLVRLPTKWLGHEPTAAQSAAARA